jgi:cardiolipin synthase
MRATMEDAARPPPLTLHSFLALPWWLLGGWFAGVLAVVSALVTLFFALGRRPPDAWATEMPVVDSREFLVGISGIVNSPLQSGGRIELLNNGDQIFPAMLDAIRGAQRTINFAVYIWEPGQVSDWFFAALTERAAAGVEVRLMLDGLGGLRAPQPGLDALRAAGGRIVRFRSAKLGGLMRFHRRNHRRAVVVDGAIAFTGGAAVGDKWLGDARNEKEWRDCMFRVTGPLAKSVQSAFATLWASCAGEMLMGDAHYPREEALVPGEPVAFHTCVTSSPSSEDHPLRLFYMLSFLAARETLYITTPYFVPDKHTRTAVASRARAGVDVRILLPNSLTDAVPIRLASHSYFEELLSAGVRIYEYQPAMMHAKSVVVDAQWSVVGSANMDIRSKELNQENVLGILDHGFGRQLHDTFLADLARAREVTLPEWKHRSVWEHVKERVSVAFAEQY